ncbi:ABC transporter permease [Oceanibaculum indicum]|uniref:ABC transporter permease n=1 Tax=Oceanibaculum indicum P24 TaxID=1207063 RepID=K2JYA1_9PROT|nr:ABC transporter permease [Oceanibaculum indicum]EKE70175.1 ABC transporter permease [Oceanibaculum indicum P24]
MGVWAIFKRELASYFLTPLAYIFIVIFLMLTATFTFFVGSFFEAGQASLQGFFGFHPWLYLVLTPAVAMRLWAEERKSGTLELLLTLPVSIGSAVAGKFLAAWAFTTIALALTFPLWITVNYLGDPDNGVILASYIGSALLAGAYLALGSALSALTRNQIIAFVLTAAVGVLFVSAGSSLVLSFFTGWAPAPMLEALRSFSFLAHFQDITRGVIDLRDVIFYLSAILAFLWATALLVDLKKGR